MLRQGLRSQRLATLTAVTAATGVSDALLQEFDFASITFKLQTANVSGTSPTLDVYLQTSDDGGTTWYDMTHFEQLAADTTDPLFATIACQDASRYHGPVGVKTLAVSAVGVPIFGRQVRMAWTIAGTSPTFDITLDALLTNISH